jgi:hypothetical protein
VGGGAAISPRLVSLQRLLEEVAGLVRLALVEAEEPEVVQSEGHESRVAGPFEERQRSLEGTPGLVPLPQVLERDAQGVFRVTLLAGVLQRAEGVPRWRMARMPRLKRSTRSRSAAVSPARMRCTRVSKTSLRATRFSHFPPRQPGGERRSSMASVGN